MIPSLDTQGELHSLQHISAAGDKRFLADGGIKGHYHSIGQSSDVLYLCEGYATGATIHEVTSKQVIIAFNAGNLVSVAQAIKLRHPNQKIIIAADNDQWKSENKGVKQSTEAAKKIGATVVIPNFEHYDIKDKPTDFNDLLKLAGKEEVKRQ